MGERIWLLFLFLLGASWACNARELVTADLFNRKAEISDVSVLQLNHQESAREVHYSEQEDGNEEVCTMCEQFASKALNYFAENKTEAQIIHILHKSCSKILSLKEECMSLVDYYVPLFFLEISAIQPGDFCERVNLCEQIVSISKHLSKDSCGLCHQAVAEALLKLKDPDTQLEIIELLLKGCASLKNNVKKCKSLVFEYGPVILVNAEQFLEANDICTILHACDSTKAAATTTTTTTTLSAAKPSMLSES